MFPVEECWPALSECLYRQDSILIAPPGAGKSTVLPLKLLEHANFREQKIIMLQPRQVAVRAIAQFLAQQLGEEVGQTIGYQMRGEQAVSANTRLLIVTEGLLTQMLQHDPELSGIGLVIFDEFHERSIHADFSLALCLDSQAALRDDLRLLVMSATLDANSLTTLMPDAQVLSSEGRSFPVEVVYRPVPTHARWQDSLFQVVLEALRTHQGSVLVFLPGAFDIQHLFNRLIEQLPKGVECHMLFGQLSKAKQIAALQAAPAGIRKVVLATNIAETSLTIADITVVVDSGLENVASFNLARNMTQLETRRICKASSVQRAGRAGRIMAGHCYRLWSQEQHQRLIEHKPPAILQLDLTDLVLNTKLWGAQISELKLIDQPTQAQIDHATDTLILLGALDQQGNLTSKGRALSEFGCHPRWANVLLEAKQKGTIYSQGAAVLVALHESNGRLTTSPLLEHHLQLLNREPHHLIWKQAKRWAQRLNCRISIPWAVKDMHSVIAHLLLYAYPDHVAKRRSNGGYQLVNGNGANWLAKDEGDCDAPWLVITQLMAGEQADSQIRLAHPIDEKWVMSAFADKIEVQERVYWHSQKQSIAARTVERLGRIELSSRSTSLSDKQRGKAVILEQIRAQGLAFLAWPESVWQWLARLKLASELFPEEWPVLDESKVLDSVETWLSPYLDNVTSLKQLQQLNWLEILSQHWLTWQQQSELKQLFPTHYTSATGRSHPLDYQGHRVTLSIRIQEVYGLSETPCVARGKLPLQLSLLSPAGRPIQTTGDLASFWQGSYKEVQKEMKGRYPKHYWPDDPASAQATSGVKKN